MASSYSSRLKIELQATGENTSTWGARLNSNALQLLDDRCSGYIAVSVSAGGNNSLTQTDGATDQSRQAVIELTGAVSTQCSLVVPAVENWWLLRNSTSGTVVVLVSGQTGVSVAASSDNIVYTDGTNTYRFNPIATPVSITQGGTGAITTATAQQNLAVEPGVDVQIYSATLSVIGAVSATKGNLIVGTGTTFAKHEVGAEGTFLQSHASATTGFTYVSVVTSVATQAEMEAASSNTVAVTPGRAQYHPGMAKAWVTFAGGSGVISASYNVASVTRNGTGDYTINFSTAFSDANYAFAASARRDAGQTNFVIINTKGDTAPTTTAHRINTMVNSIALTDPQSVSLVYFGDQ